MSKPRRCCVKNEAFVGERGLVVVDQRCSRTPTKFYEDLNVTLCGKHTFKLRSYAKFKIAQLSRVDPLDPEIAKLTLTYLME